MDTDIFIGLVFLVLLSVILCLFYIILSRKKSGKCFGDYSQFKSIGKGGMATIYCAKNKILKRIVVVKVMDSGLMKDKDLVYKFLKEGENLQRINERFPDSPVVKVLEYSHPSSTGPYFIAMEYLSGINLLQAIKSGNIPSLKGQIFILKEVARALHASHSLGILHRDISPDNIIINQNKVTLIDFGIAKQEFSEYRTLHGALVGKPFYMSPEHSAGKMVDDKTDIYSLGAIWFYMLERRPIYDSPNIIDILKMHQECPIPEITASIPQDIMLFIRQMLHKTPSARPDAREVVSRMEYFLSREDLN